MGDLLNFKDIRKFKNLQLLVIDNVRLAEGRFRREFGLGKKSWVHLFKKFPYLSEIYIGGHLISVDGSGEVTGEKSYNVSNMLKGMELGNKLASAYGRTKSVLGSSRMQRVWGSKPVRMFTKVLGYTLGVQALILGASVFGPVVLLSGALFGAGFLRRKKE